VTRPTTPLPLERAVQQAARRGGETGGVTSHSFVIRPIAWVESPLVDKDTAPNQGDEGAPAAHLVVEPDMAEGISDLSPGDEVLVLTWFDRASRDVLSLHPRGDERNPICGVFSTRSPDRPNPVGLHRVEIVSIDGLRIQVRPFEALHGTPVIDIKPILGPIDER
jgi:tRNA-Thr(GGU) m(6)t(6)A37 methyltransferase TsaA